MTSEASFSFLLKAAAAGMLLALLKFMFSSADSTEEKDYFQIVREKMLVLLLFKSLTVVSVSSLCCLGLLLPLGGCGITVCWEKDYSKP